MSAVLLLGVVPVDTPAHPEAGAHHLLPAGDLAGLAIEVTLDPAQDEATRTLAWASQQNRILAHYIQTVDVLPITLGAVFSDATVLADHIRTGTEALQAALKPLRARCEYILQLAPDTTARQIPDRPARKAVGTVGGAQFLADRRQSRDRRHQHGADRLRFMAALEADLTRWCEALRPRTRTGRGMLRDLSLLVPRRASDQLVAGLQDWGDRAGALDLHLRLIGPTPAYSFIGGDRA